ncbi:hypothetical protein DUZ99_10630 [Xylanibacillus composti]|nr:hypothetical protein [Xylanibacillus composti]
MTKLVQAILIASLLLGATAACSSDESDSQPIEGFVEQPNHAEQDTNKDETADELERNTFHTDVGKVTFVPLTENRGSGHSRIWSRAARSRHVRAYYCAMGGTDPYLRLGKCSQSDLCA